MEWPLLSLIIWLPIIGGGMVLWLGNERAKLGWAMALISVTLTFALSLPLYTGFDATLASMQFVERTPWIDLFNAEYFLGVDGISMPLILLTTFITLLIVISVRQAAYSRPAQFLAAFLFMEGTMIGVFSALDGVLFYVFWEAMLIPMFLIIGVWGGPNRIYATIKFFLYTFLGSVFMLVALIYMYLQSGSFSILDFHTLQLNQTEQTLIFIAFLLAFAVKIPMWPVHTWLPDAHVEAPTAGSVILAAIMLKLGGYGFLRFSLPITPDASFELAGFVIALSLIAIVYIGFVALVQDDMKKLIAYSSIAHMGFVTLGMFDVFVIHGHGNGIDGAAMAMQGGIFQMVSHGFISAAMFLCVGVLYDRMHSRKISDYGGVVNTMPVFSTLLVFFALANSGLPGTSGFVGEFMVILGSFNANVWFSVLAATTLVLGAAYSLWMIKRVVYGEVANDQVAKLEDLKPQECTVLVSLALLVLIMGLWPAPLVDVMSVSVDNLLQQVLTSKL